MKITLLLVLFLTGCAATPYKELKLDTTSNFKSPKEGMAGIYVYQWKRGFIGAASDVKFEIKGQTPIIPLNTGEYGYLEVKPGIHEYKFQGGIFSNTYFPVEFEANKNYFFRAFLFQFTDTAVLIRDQIEIDEAKQNISSGRYEWYSVD